MAPHCECNGRGATCQRHRPRYVTHPRLVEGSGYARGRRAVIKLIRSACGLADKRRVSPRPGLVRLAQAAKVDRSVRVETVETNCGTLFSGTRARGKTACRFSAKVGLLKGLIARGKLQGAVDPAEELPGSLEEPLTRQRSTRCCHSLPLACAGLALQVKEQVNGLAFAVATVPLAG